MNRLLFGKDRRRNKPQDLTKNKEQGRCGERAGKTLLTHLRPLKGKFPLRGYQLILRKRRTHSSQASECRNEYYEELGTAILILTQGISKMYVTHFDIQ